jgi:ABC-type dipeptide/oligopeptide/nickel transport system permease subunit
MARTRKQRLATAVITLLIAIAALASFLAADRPLLLRWQGRTYVLPNIIEYHDLRERSGDSLRARMTQDDWALWPPVPHDPDAVRTAGTIVPVAPPSARHWLGTDDRGRDVLARLIHGTRATVLIAAGAALLALLAGVFLALIALLARSQESGRAPVRAGMNQIDAAIVTLCDAAAAMPALVIVVAAQGLIGRASLLLAVVLIAIPRAADTARIARGVMIAALARPFCQAARALGASPARVLLRHALPQAVPQLAVATAITAATAVLAEAALSFLGFGTPPPTASWGELLKQAHENGLRWHLVVPAGLAVAMAAAALGALVQPDRGETM